MVATGANNATVVSSHDYRIVLNAIRSVITNTAMSVEMR